MLFQSKGRVNRNTRAIMIRSKMSRDTEKFLQNHNSVIEIIAWYARDGSQRDACSGANCNWPIHIFSIGLQQLPIEVNMS